jgi:hypothetical protein
MVPITWSSLQYYQEIKPRMRWAEPIARMGDMRNSYKVSLGKSEEKRPIGRPRLGRKNNIL